MALVTNFAFSHLTVAKGSRLLDLEERAKCVAWIRRTPNLTTWAWLLLPVLQTMLVCN